MNWIDPADFGFVKAKPSKSHGGVTDFEAIGCYGGVLIVGDGEENQVPFKASKIRTQGCVEGVRVIDASNITLEDFEAVECQLALSADSARNLAVLGMKIDGKSFEDFVGDFETLAVWSVDDWYSVGQMLRECETQNRMHKLRETKIARVLAKEGFTGWAALLLQLLQIVRD